jgi:hypothetical protein
MFHDLLDTVPGSGSAIVADCGPDFSGVVVVAVSVEVDIDLARASRSYAAPASRPAQALIRLRTRPPAGPPGRRVPRRHSALVSHQRLSVPAAPLRPLPIRGQGSRDHRKRDRFAGGAQCDAKSDLASLKARHRLEAANLSNRELRHYSVRLRRSRRVRYRIARLLVIWLPLLIFLYALLLATRTPAHSYLAPP